MTSDAYRTISLAEITAQFSAERKARIKSRATKLLDAHLALEEVSEADAPASSSADIKLSTLREYVSALGGELHLGGHVPGPCAGRAGRYRASPTAAGKAET